MLRTLSGLSLVFLLTWGIAGSAAAQSIAKPWSQQGHDAQHTGISKTASLAIGHARWSMPVDLAPQYSGSGSLLVHYASPLCTRNNTVLVAVKTGASDGFRIDARDGNTGLAKWTLTTDYTLPPHNWKPMYSFALTPKNRLYYAGAGGTLYFRDAPDDNTAPPGGTGQIAFYGLANYQAAPATFNSNVKISTPITVDRYGNLFFGFRVLGATTPALQSGIARIGEDGAGSWVGATAAVNVPGSGVTQVAMNCAPALSNDHKTVYIAVNNGSFSSGYLLALDATTLATISKVRPMDVKTTAQPALIPDDGTASPTVGPDGDVYYGVLENFSYTNNHFRGWLLHYDSTLATAKTPGAFGWDDTASIIPANLVASYTGASKYLVLTKYNNYAGAGGNGVNRLAILDPNDTMTDPISGSTVMKEVITVASPTPDDEYLSIPGAVREWCINTAAIDPFTKSAIAACEDGKVYRWDFTTNTLSQALLLTDGIGAAYTPSFIGADGTAYCISNATLYALSP